MSNEMSSSASLRIISKTLSATEITKILMMEPTNSFEKGTHLSKRNPKSQIRQESMWILESNLSNSESLENHIELLTSFVEDKIDLFRQLLSDCHIDFFCSFSSAGGQGGLVLTANLLARMTVIPVDLVVDLYPSND